jgi:RES domain-containing protein
MLEKLAHWRGFVPSNQHFVRAVASSGCSYEVFQPASHVGWNAEGSDVAASFGEAWLEQSRSALLFVPSILAPIEHNILINPNHQDAALILPERETPVWWDRRLFEPPLTP